MKVAWFTPFNRKSAIGRYSKSAAAALAKHADVDIFVFERDNLHETGLRTVFYTQENVLHVLDGYDVCVYNMGDYSGYHSAIFDVMKRRRGVVICHDLCLHNFFRGYYIEHLQRPEEYIEVLNRLYGEDNAHMLLDAANSSELWSGVNLLDYHMADLLYPHCLGIAVHSKYHAAHIKSGYKGSIGVVPLLYEHEWHINNEHAIVKSRNHKKLDLLTVGNINPNKRIESTIDAIGSEPRLRKTVHLTCIGSLANEGYVSLLRQKIAKYNMENNVRLLDFVEDKQLADYYSRADVIVNLRYPAYEGASASLVEQMQLGKAVIVSDTGVYSEMTDNCVIKINPASEVENLKHTLLDIVDNPAMPDEIGSNAKSFARENYSHENYGKLLFDFINLVCFQEPLYNLTDLFARELGTIGVTADMRICETLAGETELLFRKSHA